MNVKVTNVATGSVKIITTPFTLRQYANYNACAIYKVFVKSTNKIELRCSFTNELCFIFERV